MVHRVEGGFNVETLTKQYFDAERLNKTLIHVLILRQFLNLILSESGFCSCVATFAEA